MTKIILDACNNHLGHPEIIVAMIEEAKRLRADYIKFQLYNPDKLNELYPDYKGYKKTLQQCQITHAKLKLIIDNCERVGITPMFTIFSEDRVSYLGKYVKYCNNIAVKIASCDMANEILIKEIIGLLMPFEGLAEIFISTGMHKDSQISEVRQYFNDYYIHWLYCVSMYPTPPEYINFEKMKQFSGFSDHTITIDCAMKAVAMGMEFVEMHFTLGKSLPCKDSIISKVPSEIEQVTHFRDYLVSVGKYKNRYKKG